MNSSDRFKMHYGSSIGELLTADRERFCPDNQQPIVDFARDALMARAAQKQGCAVIKPQIAALAMNVVNLAALWTQGQRVDDFAATAAAAMPVALAHRRAERPFIDQPQWPLGHLLFKSRFAFSNRPDLTWSNLRQGW